LMDYSCGIWEANLMDYSCGNWEVNNSSKE
jgi:hypothetical protein